MARFAWWVAQWTLTGIVVAFLALVFAMGVMR